MKIVARRADVVGERTLANTPSTFPFDNPRLSPYFCTSIINDVQPLLVYQVIFAACLKADLRLGVSR